MNNSKIIQFNDNNNEKLIEIQWNDIVIQFLLSYS